MPKHRLESPTDGVYAIALTLLVFDLRLPLQCAGELQDALISAWPAYLTYLLSFVILTIGWVGHHSIMHVVKWVDLGVGVSALTVAVCQSSTRRRR